MTGLDRPRGDHRGRGEPGTAAAPRRAARPGPRRYPPQRLGAAGLARRLLRPAGRGNPASARTAMPPWANSCRRCRCRGACSPAAAPGSTRRSASAPRSAASPASPPSPRSRVAAARWSSSPSATASNARASNAWWRNRIWSTARRPNPVPPPPADAPPACPRRPSAAASPRIPPLLFRYSAVGNNGHRIHYDAPYATGTEGYPGAGGEWRHHHHEADRAGQDPCCPAPIRSVVTRAGRPLFVDRPVTLASHLEAPEPRPALGAGRCRPAGLRIRGGVRGMTPPDRYRA